MSCVIPYRGRALGVGVASSCSELFFIKKKKKKEIEFNCFSFFLIICYIFFVYKFCVGSMY